MHKQRSAVSSDGTCFGSVEHPEKCTPGSPFDDSKPCHPDAVGAENNDTDGKHMKKIFLVFPVIVAMLLCCACAKQDVPLEKMAFQKSANGEYMTIVWDGRTYVPFTSVAKAEMGKKIGYYIDEETAGAGGEDSAVYVYEFKGYSSAEWLVDYADGFMNMPALWKEVSVTEIPEGLVSDYEWNK